MKGEKTSQRLGKVICNIRIYNIHNIIYIIYITWYVMCMFVTIEIHVHTIKDKKILQIKRKMGDMFQQVPS